MDQKGCNVYTLKMPCSLGVDLSQGGDFCASAFLFSLTDGSYCACDDWEIADDYGASKELKK